MIDIYDENRNLTGKTIERSGYLEDDQWCLIVHLCLFNTKREMLIQRRAKQKAGYGGYWDISVGGGVRAGETSQSAMSRELNEELGLSYDFTDHNPTFTIKGYNTFDDYYYLIADLDAKKLTLQKEEVMDAAFKSEEEILKMIKKNKFIPYSHISDLFAIYDKIMANINKQK